jgi:hypothetical protein
MRLYKYLPSCYLDRFVDNGQVLFRSLTYFQQYEDEKAVGDRFEGIRAFRPPQGLTVTRIATGEKFTIPYSFHSAVFGEAILVFCVSESLSHELADEFHADACVEITDVNAFVSRLQDALLALHGPDSHVLLHGPVKYYAESEAPIVDWALPEQIVMSKLQAYAHQREYRFAFAEKHALEVERTRPSLVPGALRKPDPAGHREQVLLLGSIRDICEVHSWPAV